MKMSKTIQVPTLHWYISMFAICMAFCAAFGWLVWIAWSLCLLIDAALRQHDPLAIYGFIVTFLGVAGFGYLAETRPSRTRTHERSMCKGFIVNSQDIIRLAEAMKIDPNLFGPLWGNPIFDPRKDANHDYAVLEWMRTKRQGDFDVFMSYFAAQRRMRSWQYQIGDYARAALTVIDSQKQE